MSNVLVATDLSEQSHFAVQRAIQIASTLKAKLNILHVVDDRYLGNIANTIMSLAEAQLKQSLEKELTAEQIKNTNVYIVSGEPDIEILRHVDKLQAVCTVMGMHRKLTLELFSGTTVDRVCHYNQGLTLLARNKKIKPYERVLCATDFSSASQNAMHGVAVLAPDASVTAAHFEKVLAARTSTGASATAAKQAYLQEADQRLQADIKKYFDKKTAKVKHKVIEATPFDGIVKLAEESMVDLIALGKHSKSGIKLALLGSVARKLLSDPPCDILVAGV